MAPLPHSPQAPRPGLARYSRALLLAAPLVLAACGGGSDDPGIAVAPSDFAVDYSPKGYTFHWSARTGATRYELFEDPDGAAGPLPEVQIGGTIASTSYAHSLAGQLLHERVNASYRLRACDASGCGAWTAALTPDLTQAIGRFEGPGEHSYGHVVLSANGTTLAVGGWNAVYVFSRNTPAGTWQQQAHLKASNPAQGAAFGTVALSADGDTLAVGAPRESSNARGINGDESNSDAPGAGAVYVFTRNGGNWSQQAYVKARNTPQKVELCLIPLGTLPCDPVSFGASVALSADGNLLAVGAPQEGTKGIHFDSPPDVAGTGAIHTYVRSNGTWAEDAHLKGRGPDANGKSFLIGGQVALSNDGTTLATIGDRGDIYVLTRVAGSWGQPLAVWQPPPNTFVPGFALSGDGKTLAYAASTVNAERLEEIRLQTLTHSDGAWTEETVLTVSGSKLPWYSIYDVSLSRDGRALATGVVSDSSNAVGINGDAANVTEDSANSGAVNLYHRDGTTWRHSAYLKAPKPRKFAAFGNSVALSSDGKTLAISEMNFSGGQSVYLY